MKTLLIASIVLINSIYGQNEQKYNNYQYTTDSLSEIGEFENAILYLENNLAQAKNKQNKFDCLGLLCQINKETENLSDVITYGHQALQLSKGSKLENLELYGDILYNLAVAKYHYGETDSTILYGEKALKQRIKHLKPSHPKIIHNTSSLGVFHKKIGNIQKCIKLQQQALKLSLNSVPVDYISIVIAHFSLANSYKSSHNLILAQEHLQKALNYFNDSLSTVEIYKAHIYNSLGVISSELKDIEKSQEYYFEALRLFTKINPEKVINIATIQSNIANNYTNLGDLDQAKIYHNKSINVVETNNYKNELPWKYFNLGATYIESNEYSKALNILRKSKTLNEEINGPQNELANLISNHLALIYFHKNKNDKARRVLKESIEINKTIWNQKNYDLAQAYYLNALSYFKEHSYETCIKELENAEKNLVLTNELEDYKSAIISRPLLLSTSILKQKGLLGLYNKTKDTNYLYQLIESAKKVNLLYEVFTNFYFHNSEKLSLFNEIDENLYLAIQALKKLYDLDNNPKHIKHALNFFEYEKAYLLKKELQNANAKHNSNLPDSIIIKEDLLKRKISEKQNQIFNENNPESQSNKEIKSEIFKLKRELESLISRIEKEYPNYFNHKYKKSESNYSLIQKKLGENEIIIEYYKYHDHIYSLGISKNNITFHEDTITNLSDKIFEFNKSITNSDIDKYTDLAYELYMLLLKPHKTDDFQKITIIPSKDIYSLNFDCFINKKPKEIKYNKLNYLVHNHSIQYKNYITNEKLNHLKPNKNYLGILPKVTGPKYAPLKEAHKEINSVAKEINGDLLINENATKKNLLKIISDYEVIHFSGHTEQNTNNSAYSKLILSPEKKEDSKSELYAHEIQNIKLNAKLVVLSSCSSGNGNMILGEGVTSLARSFNYAGAHAVLLSLWDVADLPTSKITTSFFEKRNNKNKGLALQQAKIKYLKSSDEHLSNPIFWGGMVIYGNTNNIDIKSKMDKKIYFLIPLILIIGLLFYRKFI